MNDQTNTIIESLGIYLPPDSTTTTEVLQDCKKQIRFPLEKVSGIKTRHVAGRDEFSIDLAKQAISNCLDHSIFQPADIDLLVCCNISRYDGPAKLSFEPSTSVKLKKHFGFDQAMAFDITNACAGMFTGIYIVNTLLQAGAIRSGMVVSGEYITHLTKTAQREIESFMDSRLACLTLGDAGAAVILKKGPDTQTGFHDITLQTLGRYSPYCIAKEAESGEWIMYTDSVSLTDIALKTGAKYALDVLQQARWQPDSFQHLIMHQTSRMTLNSAVQEINKVLNKKIFDRHNTINNLEQRGNTASTSHFIALADQIQNNKIQSGDKVVFNISASGLTIGTALYTLDDLPDRMRVKRLADAAPQGAFEKSPGRNQSFTTPGIRFESVGTIPQEGHVKKDSLEQLVHAAKDCLEKSSYQPSDIGLLIFCGVYRTGYVMEPAIAALLAGKLEMNATLSDSGKNTLAFDVFNGSVGFMNACYIAQQMIAAGKHQTAMIVASEIENNAGMFPDQLMGLCETATACILDAHPTQSEGFSHIHFGYQLGSIDAYTANCFASGNTLSLRIGKDPDLEEKYLADIAIAVDELLTRRDLELAQIDLVFPPQISARFITRLGNKMGVPQERLVNAVGEGPDMFSSSLQIALEHAREKGMFSPGDTGLMIAVGSGIQVGCMIYQF